MLSLLLFHDLDSNLDHTHKSCYQRLCKINNVGETFCTQTTHNFYSPHPAKVQYCNYIYLSVCITTKLCIWSEWYFTTRWGILLVWPSLKIIWVFIGIPELLQDSGSPGRYLCFCWHCLLNYCMLTTHNFLQTFDWSPDKANTLIVWHISPTNGLFTPKVLSTGFKNLLLVIITMTNCR